MTLEVREFSARRAAREVHCGDKRVLKALEDGELGGYRTDGGQWRIPEWALREWQESRIAAQRAS